MTLKKVIQASSNPGDLVLDPFCGCGTTIDAVSKLGREWLCRPCGTCFVSSHAIPAMNGWAIFKGSSNPGGVLDREKAAIGLLISLQPATGPMEAEAASAGFYEHKTNKRKFPRLQLRTIKELMEGQGIERPTTVAATDETFKRALKSNRQTADQRELEWGDEGK